MWSQPAGCCVYLGYVLWITTDITYLKIVKYTEAHNWKPVQLTGIYHIWRYFFHTIWVYSLLLLLLLLLRTAQNYIPVPCDLKLLTRFRCDSWETGKQAFNCLNMNKQCTPPYWILMTTPSHNSKKSCNLTSWTLRIIVKMKLQYWQTED